MAEMDEIKDFLKKITEAIKDNTAAVEMDSKEWKAHKEAVKKAKEELFKQLTTINKNQKALKDAREVLKKLNADEIKFRKELEKCKKEVTGLSGAIYKGTAAIRVYDSTVGKLTQSFWKFGAAIGTTALEINGIIKTGFEYNKALFQISRSQQISGRGAYDLGIALSYVKKNTTLSRIEFLQFANIVQKSFVGLKPPLMEIAELSRALGEQFGPSLEMQKEAAADLLQVQNKFPALYNRIYKGVDLINKVNSGGEVTNAQLTNLKLTREQITLQAILAGASQQQIETILQLLTPATSEQRKYNELLKLQQQAHKSVQDAATEMFNTIQPYLSSLMSLFTKVVKLMEDWKELVIATAASWAIYKGIVNTMININTAIRSATTAQGAFNLAVMKNPYVILTAAVVGVALAVYGLHKKQEKYNALVQERVKVEEYARGLSKEQLAVYNKTVGVRLQEAKTAEEVQLILAEAKKDISSMPSDIDKSLIKWQEVKTNIEAQLNILGKAKDSIQGQINVIEKFGGTAQPMYDQLIKQTEEMSEKLTVGLDYALKHLSKMGSIELGAGGDLWSQASDAIKQIDDRIAKVKTGEIAVSDVDEEIKNLLSEQAFIQERLNAKVQIEGELISQNYDKINKTYSVREQFASAFEQRLNTERQLMESAQFGLGASVEMMQKQADLAKSMMEMYQQQNAELEQMMLNIEGVTQADVMALKNAKSQSEMENYITKVMKKQGSEALTLMNYAKQHQEITNKEMQQQQKIYELTKEVREGYLDAIREMSVGAGEFTKIIGTQEMGVTQLMNSVKKVTGVAKLNTMALGGLQERTLTDAGIGTTPIMKYTTQGLQRGASEGEEAGRLKRIYDPQGTLNKSLEELRGMITGRVGTGAAAQEKDIAALRDEEKVTEEGTYKGVSRAFKENGRNFAQGLGFSTRYGGKIPGQYGQEKYAGPGGGAGVNAVAFGFSQASKAQGGVADRTGGPTIVGTIRPPRATLPEITNKTQEEIKKWDAYEKAAKDESEKSKSAVVEVAKKESLVKDESLSDLIKEVSPLETKLIQVQNEAERAARSVTEGGYWMPPGQATTYTRGTNESRKYQEKERRRQKEESSLHWSQQGFATFGRSTEPPPETETVTLAGSTSGFHKFDDSEKKLQLGYAKVKRKEAEKIREEIRREKDKLQTEMIANADKARDEALKYQKNRGLDNRILGLSVVGPPQLNEQPEKEVATQPETGVFVKGVRKDYSETMPISQIASSGSRTKPDAARKYEIYELAKTMRSQAGVFGKRSRSSASIAKAITGNVLKNANIFANMSEEDYAKLKESRPLGSRMSLAEAQAVPSTVARQAARESREMRESPVATAEAQARFEQARGQAEAGGMITSESGGSDGAVVLLRQIATDISELKSSIFGISQNVNAGVDVKLG